MIIKVCEARQSVGIGGGLATRRPSDSNLGRSMGGLVRYLVGPGKANEHTSPTIVAASEPLFAEYADVDFTGQWASADTAALVAQLNKPMRDMRSRDELPEDRGFVFHAVMSMPPGDTVDHELWGRMAQDYISQMGFDDSERKAPCRWVAIHHGRSAEGNDHLHLAVMMIREDGTWASNGNSKRRSMQARRFIDAKYGLAPAETLAQRRGRVPYVSADVHTQHAVDGAPSGVKKTAPQPAVRREPDNDKLRRLMVAVAAQADTETAYIKGLWRAGILTRPRYAEGRTDVVTGYSVALRREDGERSQWRAAGSVHKSLRLSALRSRWEDSPQAASEAAATWHTFKGERVPEPQPLPPLSRAAATAATEIARLNGELQHLDVRDERAWAEVSRGVAGVLAEASRRHEPQRPGPLTEATEAALRDAEHSPAMVTPVRIPAHSGLARSVRLLTQATSAHDTLGWVAVLEQLGHTLEAIADARRARLQADEALYLTARTQAAVRDTATALRTHAPTAGHTALNEPRSPQQAQTPRPLPPPSRDDGVDR